MAPPLRAALSRLPIELKTLIAAFVALQDESYKARTLVASEDSESDDDDSDEEENENAIAGYGKTLSTLRLLNKEFWSSSYVLDLTCVFSSDFALAADELQRAAAHVESLYLGEGWGCWDTPPFLALFPALKKLRLHADVMHNHDAQKEQQMASGVKSLRALESLEIHGFASFNECWRIGWPGNYGPKRFAISSYYLKADLWQMVEALGTHLEVLELEFTEFDSDFLKEMPVLLDKSIKFPKLRRLVLKNVPLDNEFSSSLLSRLSSSPVTDLRIAVHSLEDQRLTFQHFRHLERISLHHCHHLPTIVADGIHRSSKFCAKKKIDCVLTSSHHSSTRPCDLLNMSIGSKAAGPTPQAANQALNFAAVRRALEFGILRLERAKLDNDLGWDLKKAMVEPLERLRLAWED
ncbi:hypothetical protein P7C70_g202, partial [Phenoliferia sp. Uapishka_3]